MSERRADYVDLGERMTAVETILTEARDDHRELITYLRGNHQPGVIARIRSDVEAVETRITELEGWRKWANGVGAAVGAIFTAALGYLGLHKG